MSDPTIAQVQPHLETGIPAVVVKPRQARPFFGRHPWVLASSVDRVDGAPADGDVVQLLSDRGQFIAWGIYNSRSRIRVRLYDWDAAARLDDAWIRARLEAAAALRRNLGYNLSHEAARLVSSEGDGLGGLVIERYAGHCIVQVTALAMAARLPAIVAAVVDLWQPESVAVRTDREMNKAEGIAIEEQVVWGARPPGPVFIEEHGIRYGVDLDAGQKTGFFLDQRENRRAAAALAHDRRVLDVCCYTGGFGLAARMLGGAKEVLGIDSSARAIATAEANAQLNSLSHVRFETADSFTRLEALAAQREVFGMVVLDPPKFARNRESVPQALRAYHHLNRLAVEVLGRNGWLITCSCSGSVSRDDLLMTLADVAQHTGRKIQVVEQRGAAPDHPVSASCLESEYLKCLICRVE